MMTTTVSATTFAKSTMLLTVSCASRLGTVAALSKFFADNGCTVIGMQQFHHLLHERVAIRTAFHPDPATSPSLAQMRVRFADVAAREERVEWKIEPCAHKLRALLLASEPEPCLHDLLFRHRLGGLNLELTALVSDQPSLKEVAERSYLRFIHLPAMSAAISQQEAELLKIIAHTKSEVILHARHIDVYSDDSCSHVSMCAIDLIDFLSPQTKGPRPYHQSHLHALQSQRRTGCDEGANPPEESLIKRLAYRIDAIRSAQRSADGVLRRRVA